MKQISKDVFYVGVNDRSKDLFEGQFPVPNGVAYNSYLIKDEKVAVLDSVDVGFTMQWLENIAEVLGETAPDYLIVSHMEPDHSASIGEFVKRYPTAAIVGNAKTFVMLSEYFSRDFTENAVIVAEGDNLSLGAHNLKFIFAPMVHWPEVMTEYDETDKTLYSADAFGKFGALDFDEPWEDEARRYYFGIVGKYGLQVTNYFKKLESLTIKRICPLHGPVLEGETDTYFGLYKKWAAYEPEAVGVTIAYTSVYGNTKKAVEILCDGLKKEGTQHKVYDLARCDHSQCVADAFKYDKLVLATTTYNGDVFPPMRAFLEELAERNFKNRKVAVIENGSWAPNAARAILKYTEGCKQLEFLPAVTIRAAVTAENIKAIKSLAKDLSV